MLPLRTQPSILKGGQLREYQLEGVNWLASLYANGANGILADEMGLGKTVQTVAMLGLLMQCGAQGPFLILAPKSTLSNWANELALWLPEARVLLLQGSKEERQVLIHDVLRPGKFDVVLTSYEMMLRESSELTRRCWRYVAIDEAHRIKNEESMLVPSPTDVALGVQARARAHNRASIGRLQRPSSATRELAIAVTGVLALTRPATTFRRSSPASCRPMGGSSSQAHPCKIICTNCGRFSTFFYPTSSTRPMTSRTSSRHRLRVMRRRAAA